MTVDRPTTSIITLHVSLITTLVVETFSMIDIVVVGSTQPINIEMPIMVDALIVPPVLPFIAITKKIVTPPSPYVGLYFDGL